MPEQIHCAHILVKTEAEISNVVKELESGGHFESIAREVSLCPSGRQGGDLGFVKNHPSQMDGILLLV